MKAIILASGSGSRLLPLTKEVPKCLLKVDGKTILDIEIGNLINSGIKDIIITTGYQAEKIEEYINSKYPDINFTLVKNERYDTTNYIYSMGWHKISDKDCVSDDEYRMLYGKLIK